MIDNVVKQIEEFEEFDIVTIDFEGIEDRWNSRKWESEGGNTECRAYHVRKMRRCHYTLKYNTLSVE